MINSRRKALLMQKLGRYEILAELGHGAMGTVYRAQDPKIGRIVALKTVRVMGTTSEQEDEYRRRFIREAQSAGKLSHPGIVTIYDVDEDAATQTPYIVMEYIEGQTLDSFLTDPELAPPPVTESLRLIQQVAEALDYAHSQNIVHRDIKPANILVTSDGRAKIADFGIAKLQESDFTLPGQILGTLAYLAPEQLKGDPLDGRADLFSLGVILYWMLTGRKPFEGDTSTLLYQIACQDPPPITDLNPKLPDAFNRVVFRALAKDPALRHQRGKEFADDLGKLLAGRVPDGAVPVPAGQTAEKAVQKAAEKTVVESRPLAVEKAAEKTIVERAGPGSPPALRLASGLARGLEDSAGLCRTQRLGADQAACRTAAGRRPENLPCHRPIHPCGRPRDRPGREAARCSAAARCAENLPCRRPIHPCRRLCDRPGREAIRGLASARWPENVPGYCRLGPCRATHLETGGAGFQPSAAQSPNGDCHRSPVSSVPPLSIESMGSALHDAGSPVRTQLSLGGAFAQGG